MVGETGEPRRAVILVGGARTVAAGQRQAPAERVVGMGRQDSHAGGRTVLPARLHPVEPVISYWM